MQIQLWSLYSSRHKWRDLDYQKTGLMPLFCYTVWWWEEEKQAFHFAESFLKYLVKGHWIDADLRWIAAGQRAKYFFEYVFNSMNFQFACVLNQIMKKIAQAQCKNLFCIILSLLCEMISWIVPYNFCNAQSGLVIFGSRNLLNTLDKSWPQARVELHTDMWVGWLIKNNDLKRNAIMSRNTFPYRNMPRMAERIHMPPSLVRHRVPLQRQIQQTGS